MAGGRANKAVCFIGGAGHSGSTLLGLILGSHSAVFYGGEMRKHTDRREYRSSCRRCGPACPIWTDARRTDAPDIYERLSRLTGRPIVVDSAKKPSYIRKQGKTLFDVSAASALLYLQRDGRAVVNSRLRKTPDAPPAEIIAGWMCQIMATQRLFDNFQGAKLKVRYEELATDPERVVNEVCTLLGLDYEEHMLGYYAHEQHPLAGNTGVHAVVNRAQNVESPVVQLSSRNAYYYGDHPLEVRLDLRWQDELPAATVALFEDFAGEFNKEMRWDGGSG